MKLLDMKLKDIPDPVWYIAALAIGGVVAWKIVKGGTKKAVDTALSAGDAVQTALAPAGSGSLGTWFSDLIHGVPTFDGSPTKIVRPVSVSIPASRPVVAGPGSFSAPYSGYPGGADYPAAPSNDSTNSPDGSGGLFYNQYGGYS